eukprot:scaffold43205_cov34-Attheya_sp.AAC.2
MELFYKVWWRKRYQGSIEKEKDIAAGRDCVERSSRSTWWEWDFGSRLFFWRWPNHYQIIARDGVPLKVEGVFKKNLSTRPPAGLSDEVMEQVRKKLTKVRDRRYVTPGFVYILTKFFAVPKGDDDIRMVYDASSCGVNENLWAPSFPLPTVESLLRATNIGSWMGDIDIGECFLNFCLHEAQQSFCGIDVTHFFPEEVDAENGRVLWERWTRCLMGLRPSPYNATQGMAEAEDVIRGDKRNASNPYRWDRVLLNLPGRMSYDPKLPWIAKVRVDGQIAGDIFIYIDDLRPVNDAEGSCWDACQVAVSKVTYLGLQSAPRKRRPPSQEGGAWAGSLVHTTRGMVVTLVSQEKWDKTRAKVRWIRDALGRKEGVDRKELERIRGFLVYVSRTYPNSIVPFLKGIHLLLDSWRDNRNDEGWKLTSAEMRAAVEDGRFESVEHRVPDDLPKRVFEKDAPRVKGDVETLCRLTESPEPEPPRRLIRSDNKVAMVRYGFGDASGAGFGSSLLVGNQLHYRTGTWIQSISAESSNYRELRNLVDTIDQATNDGVLQGAEVFMFTDNTTAEGAFFRGTSSVRPLYELVVRLKTLELRGEFRLHMIHVAGTRMIAQGTDGLSRGNIGEGVMAGEAMSSFVPLHQTAIEREPKVLEWIGELIGDKTIHSLSPEGWFDQGHGITGHTRTASGVWLPTREVGTHLWSPPPAAADVA